MAIEPANNLSSSNRHSCQQANKKLIFLFWAHQRICSDALDNQSRRYIQWWAWKVSQ